MSRLRWPDSTNSVSEKPGTIQSGIDQDSHKGTETEPSAGRAGETDDRRRPCLWSLCPPRRKQREQVLDSHQTVAIQIGRTW